MDAYQTNISEQAKAAAAVAIAENPTCDTADIATLTFLDGYMAGHKAAMEEAARIADEVLS